MQKQRTKKLNKEQEEAIQHAIGPLLIIAGAGTGKTTVITERIKRLIVEEIAKPSEILALTFTEKAAREMQDRVDEALPYGYSQMWIMTFHSFCDRILRREALHIGLDPKYKLMTEAESIQFIRKHFFDFELEYFRPFGNPNKFISGMLKHFSRLQDEDINPTEYLKWVETQKSKIKNQNDNSKLKTAENMDVAKWQELANAYKFYSDLKAKEGIMDFSDLITRTLELFRERPNVLLEYKNQFKHVLVDEFQDTNLAQYELIKMLASPSSRPNLTIVGDDSQSIYKFRGAAISNILSFQDDYKESKMVILTKNYRSTQTILDASYQLIQANNPDTLEAKLGITKNLVSMKNQKDGTPVTFIHKSRVEQEADSVAKTISHLVQEEEYDYSDFAILVRANNHAEPFMKALARLGVPHQFLGPGKLFRQPEIVELISYLRILVDTEDTSSFFKVLTIPYFNISIADILKLSNYAKRQNISLYDASVYITAETQEDVKIKPDTKEKLKKLLQTIELHVSKIKTESTGQILYYFLESTGLLQNLIAPDNPGSETRAQNISKLFEKLQAYEVEHNDASVPAVLEWIDLLSELGESPQAADTDWTNVNAVNILTVHSSKGLEFPVVFLVNLVSQRFPSTERHEQIPIPEGLIKELLPSGDYHLQEERRLFYVGMTRAQDQLYLTAADFYGEGKREKKLSQFIFEALGENATVAENIEVQGEQLSFLDYKPLQSPTTKHQVPTTHIDYLSYSQIECFELCPLHYKLRYIVQIPTPASPALSFGNSMHIALKDFYQSIKQGEKPTEVAILRCLESAWIKIGYTSKAHQEESYEAAQRYVKDYLKNEFRETRIPILLEQPFTISLPKRDGRRALKIGGKIDRIDRLEGNSIEILDYKTGDNVPTQREVDRNMQLTFYALAATLLKEEPFNKKPDEVMLSLYYFKDGITLTTKRTQDELDEAINTIYDIRDEIEISDFNCSKHMFCENCEYSMFCRSE